MFVFGVTLPEASVFHGLAAPLAILCSVPTAWVKALDGPESALTAFWATVWPGAGALELAAVAWFTTFCCAVSYHDGNDVVCVPVLEIKPLSPVLAIMLSFLLLRDSPMGPYCLVVILLGCYFVCVRELLLKIRLIL